jgi:hypothetical protein
VGRISAGQSAAKLSKTELTQAVKAQRTATRLKAQKRADAEAAAEQPITDPVGVAKNYTVASASYMTFWGYIFTYEDAGMVGEVVYDEATSSAYIKNPIAMLLAGTYIKGTYTDTQISVQLMRKHRKNTLRSTPSTTPCHSLTLLQPTAPSPATTMTTPSSSV